MNQAREETVRAIHALAKVAVEEMGGVYDESVGLHINWGQSEDYTQGFNAGYESLPREPPADDPWRSSYLSGYEQGVQCCKEHERGEYDLPEWACPDCFGTGMGGSYGPVTYTDKDGTVITSEGFIETQCATCEGTGSKNPSPTATD